MNAMADLASRYAQAFRAAWARRRELAPSDRTPLERQFLPAALEILETPAPALPRAIAWTIVAALVLAIAWSVVGRVDVVAVAPGKIVAAGKTKVIQPAETGVIKRIAVADGQSVRAGEVLIELEAAAMATAAEAARIRQALVALRLEAARHDALARVSDGVGAPQLEDPGKNLPDAFPTAFVEAEVRAMSSQYQEHRARLAALDAEIAKRAAELGSSRELAAKLAQTVPIAQRRAADYKRLMNQNFISEHGYLEREQARIEQERDLAYLEAKVKELAAGLEESRKRRESLVAEFERAAVSAKVETDKRAVLVEQELVKARARERQQVLLAPVDGIVQQLAVHTVGGVVTPAQTLMVIVPNEYQAEVEAILENKDVGFVKVGQRAEIKVETFPFTRYGTVGGVVSYVSGDAVTDEKKGSVFQARVRLDRAAMRVEERDVTLTPGMAVGVEIATGKRRAIDFLLDPIRTTVNEGMRER